MSYDAQEATCYNGRLSHDLYCVLPGAMIVVGGRSDTSGTLIFLRALNVFFKPYLMQFQIITNEQMGAGIQGFI